MVLLDTSVRGGCYCTPLLGEWRALVLRDQGLLEYSTGIFRSQLDTAVSDHMSTGSMDPCKRVWKSHTGTDFGILSGQGGLSGSSSLVTLWHN